MTQYVESHLSNRSPKPPGVHSPQPPRDSSPRYNGGRPGQNYQPDYQRGPLRDRSHSNSPPFQHGSRYGTDKFADNSSRERGGGYRTNGPNKNSPLRETISTAANLLIQTKEPAKITPKKKYCPYCDNNDHWSVKCPELKKLTPEQKKRWVIDEGRCRRCGYPHTEYVCEVKGKCNTCEGDHQTAFHDINPDEKLLSTHEAVRLALDVPY